MSLIVIKLGGSVVTHKDSPTPKPRIKIIKSLAKEILSISKRGYKIILIHGGGSYGHNLAKKYNLIQGLKEKKSYEGFIKTVQSMNKLNSIIIDLLEKVVLPAVSLPPHSFITQTNGKLNDFDTSVIRNILELGIIPVLYGDPVIDTKIGCSILSGDSIATYLAKKLNAKKVIFLTDVDGIFDSNPKINKNAELIPLVNNQNITNVLKNLTSHNNFDVSGEMKGKILSIKENLPNKNAVIANGLKSNILTEILTQNTAGTKIFLG